MVHITVRKWATIIYFSDTKQTHKCGAIRGTKTSWVIDNYRDPLDDETPLKAEFIIPKSLAVIKDER